MIMKKDGFHLLKKLLLIFLPFVVAAGIVGYADPYEYFGVSTVVSSEEKYKIAYPANYALWKLSHYKKDPLPNILLGDSRVAALTPEIAERFSNFPVSNLAYGGGTLPEVVSTFWFVAEQQKLERVYVGVNINLYNDFSYQNRVTGALSIIENPALYFINRDVWTVIWYLGKKALFSSLTDMEKPKMSREEFWQYQLTTGADEHYRLYDHPQRHYEALKKISDYCRGKNIELMFIILPTHVDLQNQIGEYYGLRDACVRMREDLRSLGAVLDFDYNSDFTSNEENFKDPYHLEAAAVERLAEDVFGRKQKIGRRLNRIN